MIEAIEQGTCAWCGETDDNFSVLDRTFHSLTDEQDGIEREVVCSCGVESTVTLTEEGVEIDGPISLTDASWNDDEEDEDESDE